MSDLKDYWKNGELEKAKVSDEDKKQFQNRYKHNDMKPFRETAFGRTLAGQNNTGRWIHGIIDVAPIPNIHEVIKAVIKDEQTEEKVLGTTDIVKETFRRLDWTRTIVGSLVVVAFVMDWISVEKAEQIVNVLTGLI